MKTLTSFITKALLTIAVTLFILSNQKLIASPYSDAMNLPSWFQDQEQTSIPQPGGEGPSGWAPVNPDNSPESPAPEPEAQEPVDLHLTSSAFANGAAIPLKYTCDGANISPTLSWSNVPDNTKSLVMLVSDVTGKSHWVLFNIAPTASSLNEAFPISSGTLGGVDQGVNGYGLTGYSGPCPKLNNDSVTLSFTLMALDYAPVFEPKTVVVTEQIKNADGTFSTIIIKTIEGISDESIIEKAINHVIGKSTLTGTYKRTAATIKLESSEVKDGVKIPVFENGASIPAKFTCDGDNVSPPLNWEGVPEAAKSLVLLVTDNARKSLWVAYSIDPTMTTSLPQAIPNEPITSGLSQGLNDFNTIGYTGPCPTNVGNYTFTLMALSTVPSLTAGTATMADVYAAIDGHLVGIGMLTGTYKRTHAVINLQSSAFVNGTNIPIKYTCDSSNISPPLNWEGVPANAKSLVLLVTDQISNRQWGAFGIAPSINKLSEGIPNVAIANLDATSQIFQVKNDNDPSVVGYSGPCPESVDATVKYVFTLMALNYIPDLVPGTATMDTLVAATNNHVLGVGTLTGVYNRNTKVMTLSSDFSDGGAMDAKYTCDGTNVSPPLNWSGEPDNTKSLVLLMTDNRNGKGHWAAFNIGKDKHSLPANIPKTPSADGISQGLNEIDPDGDNGPLTGTVGYSGPCPDLENDTRTYSFTIIALNETLTTVAPGANYADVVNAMSDNIVGSGSMTGTYTRTIDDMGGGIEMSLHSTAFPIEKAGTSEIPEIPIEHTCDGLNTSPPLSWNSVPATAKSLVLSMTDNSGKSHWVAFGIPTSTRSLPAAIPKVARTNGFFQGMNGIDPDGEGDLTGTVGYTGPCPTVAGASNTYTFSIMAVSKVLPELKPGASNEQDLKNAISGYVVGSASLKFTYKRTTAVMDLTSESFKDGEAIPAEFTCDGDNVSPQLQWDNTPGNTKSLVVIATDAAKTSHWVAFGIMPTISSLDQSIPNSAVTNGIYQGLNGIDPDGDGPLTTGSIGYFGPCPASIGISNTYTFTVMALNNVPDLAAGSATLENVMTAISGHVIGSGNLTGTYARTVAAMTLESSAFTNGAAMPVKYTCDGENVSPPLKWGDVPPSAKSLFLIMRESSNEGTNTTIYKNVHWLVFNVTTASMDSLPENLPNGRFVNGINQAANGFDIVGYSGPCPKVANVSTTYSFSVVALDIPNLSFQSNYDEIMLQTEGHIVGSGTLTGTYQRQVVNTMSLQSADLPNGADIPPQYTCDGANTSPRFTWSGVPATAQSLVLLMTDAAGKSHWVAFDIPVTPNSLPSIPKVPITNGIYQGLNGIDPDGDGPLTGSIGYSGPCPETAGVTNTYTFTLMALNTTLNLAPGTSDMAAVQAAVNGHLVGSATLTRNYTRTTTVIKVESSDSELNDEHKLNIKYTCDGSNVSPPLNWSGAPVSTKSFIVLTTDDTRKSHWVAFNIGSGIDKLPEAVPNTAVADGVAQGGNDFSTIGYSGPCPDVANVKKSYTFTVMALDITLNLTPGSLTTDNAAVMAAANGHIVGSGSLTGTYTRTTTVITLQSTAFTNGNAIPVKHTCDGDNVSPPLNWYGVPDSTKSFILLTTDASLKTHWVAFNISSGIDKLPEAIPNVGVANGVSQGGNYLDEIGYSGPCPDVANVTKSYTFTIMALDITLNLTPGSLTTDNAAVMAAASGHIVGSGSLTGTYTRITTVMEVTSTFEKGEAIPVKYTCDGNNVSPPLNWSNPPVSAKSFIVLTTDDTRKSHWVAFNIGAGIDELPEAVPNTAVADGVSQGGNDFSTIGYSGPCPDVANVKKSYTFTVMALDITLNLTPGSLTTDNAAVMAAANGHIVGSGSLTGTYIRTTTVITVESLDTAGTPVFTNGAAIPVKYTCDGDNVSPPLSWKPDTVPVGTKSFIVLTTDDTRKSHWVAFNIGAGIYELPEAVPNTAVADGVSQGGNDFSTIGYSGPCPDVANVKKSYTFTVMALDITLNLTPGSLTTDNAAVMAAASGHIVGSGSLTGTYIRTTTVITVESLDTAGTPVFTNGAAIPVKYTCDGDNVSPPLSWKPDTVPVGTKSFIVLTTDDTRKSHWVAFNIGAGIYELPEAVPNTAVADGVSQGGNDFSTIGYSGPCPDVANVKKSYTFTVMALDITLNLTPGSLTTDNAAVMAAASGHIVGSGSLTGTYIRTTTVITLQSTAFTNGAAIPVKYTCNGDNVSPPLSWEGVPEEAKSLVLLVTDNTRKSLWIAYSIDPTITTNLPSAIPNEPITKGLSQGLNDFNTIGYAGPCPTNVGNYTFTLMALNTVPSLAAGTATIADVYAATDGHLVGIGMLTGTYKRTNAVINLQSSAFVNGTNIPMKYTCDGDNISPPLNWAGVPENTKSLVLLVTDQVGNRKWGAFSIAPSINKLSEAVPNVAIANLDATSQIFQVKNDNNPSVIGYSGPCPESVPPASADETVKYVFTLMALNYIPDVAPGSTMDTLVAATNNHVVGIGTLTGGYNRNTAVMTLSSSAFSNSGAMPAKYTCDGIDVSPPLNWSGAPESTKSLVLLVTDNRNGKSHWVAYNIGRDRNSLPEAIPKSISADGIEQNKNSFDDTYGYSGPCPDLENDTRIYSFTIIALNIKLTLDQLGGDCIVLCDSIIDNIVGSGSMTGTYTRTTTVMTVESTAFTNGNAIPVKYTCDGANVSPPLSWANAPASAKSFIVLTTDASRKSHWVAFNIGSGITSLPEAVPNVGVANGVSQGGNDFSTIGYSGPCPDVANVKKSYTFTVMALDITLNLTPGSLTTDNAAVMAAASGHIVGSGSLTGTYTRITTVMEVTSTFEKGEAIPVKYTCDGNNVSPPLNWSNPPVSAKSFIVLTTDDTRKSHWVAFNIGAGIDELPEAVPNTAVADGVSQGGNDFSTIGYSGPCPDVANVKKSYTFTVMALDITLNLTPGSLTTDNAAVMAAASGHIVGSGSLTGTYTRITTVMEVTSTFEKGEAIPVKYTCDGNNVSPPLNWSNPPVSAKSFIVLTTDDTRKSHWVAFNIGAGIDELPEAVPNTAVADGVSQGGNDFSTIGYSGPCPDVANVKKSYTFTVMALDITLNLTPGSLTTDNAAVMAAASGHIVGSGSLTGTYIRTTTVITLQSTAFTNGNSIPVKHTCDGDNVSPPLNWSGAPVSTKSFIVLTTDDTRKSHWVAFNIGAGIDELPEAVPNTAVADGVSQGANDFSTIGYSGPCPDVANVKKSYTFTVMALDITLNLTPGSLTTDNAAVMAAASGHIVGSGSLTGTYIRTTTVITVESLDTAGTPVFTNGAAIPVKYTCDGDNVSPPLNWSGAPVSTKSFIVLTTDDTRKSHWVAFNIGAGIDELPEAVPNTAVADGVSQGANDFSTIGYSGPCPDVANVKKSYTFTVMALDITLNLTPGSLTTDNAAVMAAASGHIVGSGSLTGTYIRTTTVITLQSTAFTNGNAIPVKHTCDGDNVSPPLNWSGAPVSTKSFIVLTTDDTRKSHWVAFNIGSGIDELPEAVPNTAVADGVSQGGNDFSTIGYSGPCPDVANVKKSYTFTVMALDITLNLTPGSLTTDNAAVMAAASGHIVGSGSLTGTYIRTTTVITVESLDTAGTPVFTNGAAIPVKYTCDGDNVSPPLNWSGAPVSTKSFIVLTTDDTRKSHWVAFNIGAGIDELPEAVPNTAVADGVSQGANDFSTIGYSGPCPDVANVKKSYTFTVMALDITLNLTPGSLTTDNAAVMAAASGHIVGSGSLTGTYIRTTTVITLQSTEFTNGNAIPVKHTCDGDNVSPPLNWSGAPVSTKSFIVLTTDDTRKSHWVAFNIGAGIDELPEAVPNTAVADGVSQGANDFSTIGYSGPCPDVANVKKSYTFTVMALDITLNLTPGSLTTDNAAVMAAASGHIVGSGSLTGTYIRTTTVITLQSTAFTNGNAIPVKHTCDGDNISPPLHWSSAPDNTKSFILIATESTHPELSTQRVHWVAFNMASTVTTLPGAVPNTPVAGVGNVTVPQGTNDFLIDGSNDVFTVGYSGPCPDVANITKSYTFTVMALDVPPLATLIPGVSNAADVFEAVHPYIVGSGSLTGTYKRVVAAMTLTSTSFADGDPILPNHTCVGDGTGRITSPPLAWSNVPSNAKSLVLLAIDANPTDSTKIAQWVVFNIPSTTPGGLSAGIPNVSTYKGFSQGANHFGGIGYAAPCPPVGDPTHTYVFTLMALDTTLNQDPLSANYTNIFTATTGHVITTVDLTGTVERPISGNNFSLMSSAIVSPDYAIPQIYTCDGSSLSPPLQWDNTPAGTKSLVLTMTGTGAPDATGTFDPAACHWAAVNIPATQTGLTAGQANTFFTGAFYQPENYLGWYGYTAPCPQQGTTGNYLFTLTALSQQLSNLSMQSTCDEAIDAILPGNVLATATLSGKYERSNAQGGNLSLKIPALDGGTFEARHTCDGDGTNKNVSLPLTWSNVPKTAKSLAIVMTDGDADTTAGEPVAHWITYDIPVTQSSLPENMPRLPLVYNTYQGINDFELVGYNGPCPTQSDGVHRYIIEIFALSATLSTTLASNPMTYAKFLELTRDKIIQTDTVEGSYERVPEPNTTFVLNSTGTDTFGFGKSIPSIYTCDSQNVSPELTWDNPPANTQAFVMLLTDFNAPVGSNALWVLYNIPQNISKLERNVPIGVTTTLPGIANQAWNDLDVAGYSGPCPPAGGGPRQYVFKLIALSSNITGVTPRPTYAEIITAMQGRVLGTAELNGTYERQTGGVGAFKLSSPAFADNGILPVQYRSSGFKFIKYKVVGCGTVEDPAFCVKYDDNDDNAETIATATTFFNETTNNSNEPTSNENMEWGDDDPANIEGENISPPLNWDNVPDGTKSLVLILKNEEAAESNQSSYWTGNTHWIVYDIPPELAGLDEDVAKIGFTGGFYQGKNEAPWAVGFHNGVGVNIIDELQAPQGTQPTEIPGANIAYADFEDAYAAMKAHYKLAYYNGYWGPFLPSALPITSSNSYVFTLIALSKKLEIYPYDIPVKYETFYQYLIDKMLGSIIGTAELLRVRIPAAE